jgi:hypothetical protein
MSRWPMPFSARLARVLCNIRDGLDDFLHRCGLAERFSKRFRKRHRVPARLLWVVWKRVVDERKYPRVGIVLKKEFDLVPEASETVGALAMQDLDRCLSFAVSRQPDLRITSPAKLLKQSPPTKLVATSYWHRSCSPLVRWRRSYHSPYHWPRLDHGADAHKIRKARVCGAFVVSPLPDSNRRPLLTMRSKRQPDATHGKGFRLSPWFFGTSDLPVIATGCNHGAP